MPGGGRSDVILRFPGISPDEAWYQQGPMRRRQARGVQYAPALATPATGMVRWRETMLYLKANDVGTVYEIGAGRVLTGIARRFDGIEARIQHQRRMGVLGQLVQQQAAERGLAGAHFAGELHESAAAALLDAVEQVRQGIPMVFAEEHVMRVRGDRERRLFEAVVLQIHGGLRRGWGGVDGAPRLPQGGPGD